MQLKSIEIHGFKSFPEKTLLEFEKPVTVIVGPNGSGKSNISDAMLWVMGEQSSRALRGGKMEDVIFGGTATRAQMGFAEVSLNLNNSDGAFNVEYSEVVLTRRYYRSGESEYYINRSAARLRDISEMLMDTGLGREGYSIIGQGKIDEILSARSKDRRGIFEEAVGISRFRHKKEEAERKLQHTDENLLRVNDKISELELQVTPLRQQAETAKKYLLLRDELRGLEISVWADSLDKLKDRIHALEDESAKAKVKLESATAELDAAYKSAEMFSERMRGKDMESDSVRERITAAQERRAQLDGEEAVYKLRLENNAQQIERAKQELLQQESRAGGLGAQISEREERVAQIDDGRSSLRGRMDDCINALREMAESADANAGELGALMVKEQETRDETAELKSRLSALAARTQDMLDRDAAAAAGMSAMGEKLTQLRNDRDSRLGDLDDAREKAVGLGNAVSGHVRLLEGRSKKAADAESACSRLRMEFGAAKSRISLLTEMEREYQGYSKAVKYVLQESARGALKRIRGTAAGLLRVPDGYALAIETALGGAMQNIVVDTEDDAKAAIGMLKRRDVGRATFLPISSVRGVRLREQGLEREAGFEGIALDLIQFDGAFTRVYESLLGRVVVADNLDNAIAIARRYGNRFKIVTLDGQVINAGGSMTGGSTSKGAGVISRANELEQLGEQARILENSLADAEKRTEESARETAAAEYALETARDELRSAEDAVLKLEINLRHCEQLIEAAEISLRSQKTEISGIQTRLADHAAETDELRAKIDASEAAAASLRDIIGARASDGERLSDERARLGDELAKLRADDAARAAEREALAKAISELSALRDDLTGNRQTSIEGIADLTAMNEEIRALIESGAREAEELDGMVDEYKRRIAQISAEKLELEAERASYDKDTRERNRALLELERDCARLEQKKLSADMEEKQIIDKLWDTYELSRGDAMRARAQLDAPQEAGRRIAELKREIAGLGTPNIGAIDEFERVNARYEYLTEQRDDVERAKKELVGIISEITAHMREIFSREFRLINDSFKETFVELFGGGRANLSLEDPDDVLGSGIEIEVQPPGKSLKTITLLSGGEKAFVAIAIYFAILKVRPAAFVVLDEIEAALDDANVIRFADYMRRMSEKTQMIVISHRRGTMEEADVLYGVTMQEMGVSRVLTLDIEDAERTIKAS
ncbi:MAG: chromosome segregation protein SMC [Oscillospiraceae bacterium]|nr:chromosome segregation protein SMC [Oscillospiraceae bacterium]